MGAPSGPRRWAKRYVDAIDENTVTFGIGPAGTGKTYLAVAKAVAALQGEAGQPHHPHAPRRRGGRAAGSCPAPSTTRSTPTCGRSTTRCTTWSTPTRSRASSRPARSRWRPWHHARADPERRRSSSSTRRRTPSRADEDVPDRLGFGSRMVVTEDADPDRPPRWAAAASGRPRHPHRPRGRHFAGLTAFDVVRHRLVGDIVDHGRGREAAQGPRLMSIDVLNETDYALDEFELVTRAPLRPGADAGPRGPTSACGSSTRRRWRPSTSSGWTCPAPPTS